MELIASIKSKLYINTSMIVIVNDNDNSVVPIPMQFWLFTLFANCQLE